MGFLSQLLGVQEEPAPAAIPEAYTQNPRLAQLLGAQAKPSPFRAFAAGMAAPNNPYDPFAAFGQGLGGAQGYYGEQEQKELASLLDLEKTKYQQQQDALSNARADKSLSLTEQNMAQDNARADAQEARQKIEFERQSAAYQRELDYIAANNGISSAEMREIEAEADKIASEQAFTEAKVTDFGDEIPAKSDLKLYRQLRDEIIQTKIAAKTGKSLTSKSLSDQPTDAGPSPDVWGIDEATGKKVVIRNGKPIPVE